VLQLLDTANVVPSSLILFTLMMEAMGASEISVLTRAALRHIPEDGIFRDSFVLSSKRPVLLRHGLTDAKSC
jgi:hypothetical protein